MHDTEYGSSCTSMMSGRNFVSESIIGLGSYANRGIEPVPKVRALIMVNDSSLSLVKPPKCVHRSGVINSTLRG